MSEHQDQSRRAAGKMKIAMERMVKKYPFHANLIALGRVVEDRELDTIAVTIRGGAVVFLYCPGFVCDCSFDELMGVLHHETNHVLFLHVFADPKNYPDRIARIIAEEVTVNEWVREPLPGQPITLAQFPILPPGEDTDTRYLKLVRKRPWTVLKIAVGALKNRNLDTKTDARGIKIIGVRPLDDHDVWAEIRAAGAIARVAVKVAVNAAGRALSPEQWQSIPREIRDQIDRVAQGDQAGSAIQEIESSASCRGVNNWQRILRRYVGQAVEVRPVFNRPPRRFPELLGIAPGQVRRAGKPRVMAIIDTSASINIETMEQICGELHRLSRSHDVSVVECDAKIHASYAYAGPIRTVKGRGGTDLRPPFEPAFLKSMRPDLLVYFTDGIGPAPSKPPCIPVIWCLTAAGQRPADWGRAIVMGT